MNLTRRQFLLGMTAVAGAAALPFRESTPLIQGKIGRYEGVRFHTMTVEEITEPPSFPTELPPGTVMAFTRESAIPSGWTEVRAYATADTYAAVYHGSPL